MMNSHENPFLTIQYDKNKNISSKKHAYVSARKFIDSSVINYKKKKINQSAYTWQKYNKSTHTTFMAIYAPLVLIYKSLYFEIFYKIYVVLHVSDNKIT